MRHFKEKALEAYTSPNIMNFSRYCVDTSNIAAYLALTTRWLETGGVSTPHQQQQLGSHSQHRCWVPSADCFICSLCNYTFPFFSYPYFTRLL